MDLDHQAELNFDQKLVAKIKEEKIAPRPRWHFLLKNYVIWAAGIIALLIGAAAVSVLIYLLKYNDWEIYDQAQKSFGEFFLLTLPYFWLIFLGIFVYILYYNFKHTKRGYKYPVWFIYLFSILISVILGAIFFLSGLGEEIDDVLGAQVPWYDTVINQQVPFWSNPLEGRLTGIVVEQGQQNSFTIIDPAGELWQVSYTDDDYSEIAVGSPVRMVGQAAAEKKFSSTLVKTVHSGRGFFKRPNMRRIIHERCPDDDCSPPPDFKRPPGRPFSD